MINFILGILGYIALVAILYLIAEVGSGGISGNPNRYK